MTVVSILLAAATAVPTIQVRVDGEGFLRFVRDGRTVYAREVKVTVAKGVVVSEDGLPIVPRIQAQGSPDELRFESDGRIYARYQGIERLLGKTLLAVFPGDVRPVEVDGWLVSSARPTTGQPGSAGFGAIMTVGANGGGTQTASVTTISLKKAAEVKKDVFTLGDIADVTAPPSEKSRLESLEISSTPAFGVDFTLSQEMIKGRLRRHGAWTEALSISGESNVTVSRKGQRVTYQMFAERALTEALAKSIRASVAEPTATVADMVVPEGSLSLQVARFETSGSRVSVTIDVLVDGKRINGRVVALESEPMPVLNPGQSVKLVIRSNNAVVETTAKVKSYDKATGVATVVAATGAVMTGRAVNAGTVEVTL